ncbi:MAG: hypothetical protein Fur0042_15470 [Cyanophyceae cyanobacterium]
MGVGFGVRCVIDANEVELAIVTGQPASQEVTSDATKTVNCDSNHYALPSRFNRFYKSVDGTPNHILSTEHFKPADREMGQMGIEGWGLWGGGFGMGAGAIARGGGRWGRA